MVGPATEDKEGLGDVYKVVNIRLTNIFSRIFTIMTRANYDNSSQMKEYFGYSLYSYYDMEKDLVDSEVDIMHLVDLLKL